MNDTGKENKEENCSGEVTKLKDDDSGEEYKLPLVWIDLEMTGND